MTHHAHADILTGRVHWKRRVVTGNASHCFMLQVDKRQLIMIKPHVHEATGTVYNTTLHTHTQVSLSVDAFTTGRMLAVIPECRDVISRPDNGTVLCV